MRSKSNFAGKIVRIKSDVPTYGGQDYAVEDWWERVSDGVPWAVGANRGNPACMQYAARRLHRLPEDNDVLYGKIGPFGHLFHISEIEVKA